MSDDPKNLQLLLQKIEHLCARCERLHRENITLKKNNQQLHKDKQTAKQRLGKILERLPNYYE